MGKKLAVYEDDEFYLTLRAGKYCVHGTFDGRRIRKSCGTTNLGRAKLFLEDMKRQYVHGWREGYDRADLDWRAVAEKIHGRQKSAAVKRGITFDLKAGEVYALMRSTGFRCAISGVAFAKRDVSEGKRDPWAPSIDRIENRQSYSLENVRVVCLAANIAMSDWGFDVLLRLSRGIHRSSLVFAEELVQDLNKDSSEPDKPLIRLVNLT